jgi:hypothetical protein
LRERDLGGLVDALLDEGDVESAWSIAHEGPDWDPGLPWYMFVVDESPLETGRRAYAPSHPGPQARPPRRRRGRPERVVCSQDRISASITAAAQHSSRCSTRPASTDAPTEAARRPSWGIFSPQQLA